MVRRTDRLYALVEELRARAPRLTSRARLAELLEVTPRTVERDILALQQAGVPIWSQRGPAGGYALDAQWSLPPLNFDATEALAVITALAATRSLPFADAGRRAEQKLLAAMTAAEAARAKEVAGRLRLGEFPLPPPRRVRREIERAVLDRRVVVIDYRDRDGSITSRPVEAHGLHLSPEGSYLVGWCRMRDGERNFRLDRILSASPTDEIAPERKDMPAKRSTGRTGGPPRKAQNRTGSNPAFARAIATALPGTQAKETRGSASFFVGDQMFLNVDADEYATVWTAPNGEVSFVLGGMPRDDTRQLIEQAWASYAPKRSVTAYRKKRDAWAALPPITEDDIRRIVAGFPGANEGPIWGTEFGFRATDEKKSRFARFGPPEGGPRIGNLLPPDDEHAMVIFHCDQKPSLLAAAPDKFFTTPHYGPAEEPGGIIVRLSELRGDDDLAEIAELLEDAWRGVAPRDRVAELDRSR